MKMFEPINTLSKNKASVGDTFLVDNVERTVTQVTGHMVVLSNKKEYPKQLFNNWMRISKAIREQRYATDELRHKVHEIEDDLIVLHRNAEEAYQKRWAKPAKNNTGGNTSTLPYIVLTDGKDIFFYLSPTTKATTYDLEMSFKSQHGTKFYAFANGVYIQYADHVILIGMHSFRGRNLSAKRKKFALACFRKHMKKSELPVPRFYESMEEFFEIKHAEEVTDKLLSSESEPPAPTVEQEPKHWSGLNGEIAQDIVDQGMQNDLEQDWEYPF
jgi:hypothetical protein